MNNYLPNLNEFLENLDKTKLHNAEDADDIWIIVETTLAEKYPHENYDYEPPEIIRERVDFMKKATSILCNKLFGKGWLNEHECQFFKTTVVVPDTKFHTYYCGTGSIPYSHLAIDSRYADPWWRTNDKYDY